MSNVLDSDMVVIIGLNCLMANVVDREIAVMRVSSLSNG